MLPVEDQPADEPHGERPPADGTSASVGGASGLRPTTAPGASDASGGQGSASELFAQLYEELRARAQRMAAGAATLPPTALVHEAWLKLAAGRSARFADRAHFLRAAAAAMRCVVIDHVRARRTQRRGGDARRVPLDDLAEAYEQRRIDVLALDEALSRMGGVDEQLVAIVELRFFVGLEMREVAEALGTSLSTAERSWRTAKAWLRAELGP